MPHLTQVVLKGPGRRVQRYPVPFKELLPLTLKDYVSGRGDKQTSNACLQEMAVMLACFKKNEFNESLCGPEMNAFQKCAADHKAAVDARYAKEKEGGTMVGSHRLSARQLNRLLKEHKQPR